MSDVTVSFLLQIEDAMLMFDKQTNRHRGKYCATTVFYIIFLFLKKYVLICWFLICISSYTSTIFCWTICRCKKLKFKCLFFMLPLKLTKYHEVNFIYSSLFLLVITLLFVLFNKYSLIETDIDFYSGKQTIIE